MKEIIGSRGSGKSIRTLEEVSKNNMLLIVNNNVIKKMMEKFALEEGIEVDIHTLGAPLNSEIIKKYTDPVTNELRIAIDESILLLRTMLSKEFKQRVKIDLTTNTADVELRYGKYNSEESTVLNLKMDDSEL